MTPATITLALRIRQLDPGDAADAASWVLFAGAVVAVISNPLFGALSDRTVSRFGRRKPYLVLGAVFGFLALACIAVAGSVTAVLISWCLAQLAYNAVLAALVAIVADRIPASRRGTVVGVLGMCMPVGQISGTFLVQYFGTNLRLALLVPGLVGLIGVWGLAVVLPRERFDGVLSAAASDEPATTLFLGDAGRRPDFAWAWWSRAFFVVGSVCWQAYQPFLLLNGLKFPAEQVPRLIFQSTLVQAAMTVLWSLLAGRLSDRLKRRKAIAMVGSTLQGVGLWIIAVAHSYEGMLLGVAVAGMGHGVYEGVDLALVTEVLPDRDRHAAKDLGLLNVANALPQVITPLVAPAILSAGHGSYTLLFLAAGAVPVLGAALLVPIKGAR